MTSKDYLVLVVPLVALLVAILTTVFNIWDRRRKLHANREKLAKELLDSFLQNSTFIEDKYRVYNTLMAKISQITGVVQSVYDCSRRHREEAAASLPDMASRLFDLASLQEVIADIILVVRENQIVFSQDLHKWFTRIYSIALSERLERMDALLKAGGDFDQVRQTEVLNTANEVVGQNDKAKGKLRAEMGAVLSSLVLPKPAD